MKHLEPIFKYHFWILLSLGLIMSFTGWWVSTGQMQAAIKDQKAKIDKAEKQIPKPSDEVPSADWEASLKRVNVEQKALVDESTSMLYARQKEKMVWPEVIRKEASTLKYRGEFDNISPLIFRNTGYPHEKNRVYQIPRPISQIDGKGVVEFAESTMPSANWGASRPTSSQMWDAMEDLWLLEPILEAILTVNGGPDASRFDAAVVSIDELQLLGGDRSKLNQATPEGANPRIAPAPVIGRNEGLSNKDYKRERGTDAGIAPGNPMTSGFANVPPVNFAATDELGDPNSNSTAPDLAVNGPVKGVEPTTTLARGARRYVDDDANLPYRTRGFKLSVTMDHNRLPDFYAELTSSGDSPWPIQILRMHLEQAGQPANGMAQGTMNGLQMRRDERSGPFRDRGNAREFANPPALANPVPTASIETAYLARVTLVGLITLYNEPDKPKESTGQSTSPSNVTATEAEASSDGSNKTPAEGEMTAEGDEAAMPAAEAAAEGDSSPDAKPDSATDGEEESPRTPAPAEEPTTSTKESEASSSK